MPPAKRGNAALDEFDLRLLELLQADAHAPMEAIASQIGLSTPACYRRVRRLRESGAIRREAALVDPATMGWPISLLVFTTLEREGPATMREVMDSLEKVPEVIEAWNVTGDHDFIVRMVARDMESYDAQVLDLFAADENIRSFKTVVILRQAKHRSPIPSAPD